MTVALTAIAFNHGLDAGEKCTLPLRYNERQPVNVPEWMQDMRSPSVAAYIRDRLPATASILARFFVTPSEPRTLEIRARSSGSDGTPRGAPLPDLTAERIGFSGNGDSGWCAFPLKTADLAAGGVGWSTSRWTWQVRQTSGGPWIDFDQSVHTTYVVLSLPTAPWSVTPAVPLNPSLPWAQVLDVACDWASGSQNTVDAASRITQAVYDLGGRRLTYDAALGGPHYTVLGVPRFLCEAFLDRLRGGDGFGPLVNCSDCGTIVSTFANVLGADLWQSKMGFVAPRFALNPILAIGSQTWSTVHGAFGFHEVAWSGNCSEQDTIYDACLETDADDDPTTAPHTPSLPMNQLFGAVGDAKAYRAQIAAPSDRALCAPAPGLRIRRPVSSATLLVGPPLSETAAQSVWQRLGSPNLQGPTGELSYHFVGFHFFGIEFPGWSLIRSDQYDCFGAPISLAADLPLSRAHVAPGSFVQVSLWHSQQVDDARLRIESFDNPSADDARRTLLRVVAELECPVLEPWKTGDLGDFAFRSSNGALAALVRGNHVHLLRSAGLHTVDVTGECQRLDRVLTGTGFPTATVALTQQMRMPAQTGAGNTWARIVLRGVQGRRDAAGVVVEPGNSGGNVTVFTVTIAHTAAIASEPNA